VALSPDRRSNPDGVRRNNDYDQDHFERGWSRTWLTTSAAVVFTASLAFIICVGLFFWAGVPGKIERTLRRWSQERAEREEALRSRAAERERELERQRAQRLEEEKSKADTFADEIKGIIEEHKYNLVAERKKYVFKDAYGNENLDQWIGKPMLMQSMIKLQFLVGNDEWFLKGMPYFWYKVILPRTGNTGEPAEDVDVFFERYEQYRSVYSQVVDVSGNERIERDKTEEDWYAEIATYIEEACQSVLQAGPLESVGEMSGVDYEKHCADLLEAAGWSVSDTAVTGDQGVDLIATKNNARVCIQCKRYSSPVGNKAVQEVTAGMTHWNGTHAVVVSNAEFTRAAKRLAESTGVVLIAETELANLENRINAM
jgi:restriction system protein